MPLGHSWLAHNISHLQSWLDQPQDGTSGSSDGHDDDDLQRQASSYDEKYDDYGHDGDGAGAGNCDGDDDGDGDGDGEHSKEMK